MPTDSLKYLDEIKERIIWKHHPEKIILFGSYAKETNSLGSDLDLLIILSNLNNSRRKTAINILSTLSDLPAAVDVIVCTNEDISAEKEKNYSIIASALKEGKVLYEQS
jgi:uncharacterized protein